MKSAILKFNIDEKYDDVNYFNYADTQDTFFYTPNKGTSSFLEGMEKDLSEIIEEAPKSRSLIGRLWEFAFGWSLTIVFLPYTITKLTIYAPVYVGKCYIR